MSFVWAFMFAGATAGEPLILEHCIEETEQSEPFCFLEKLTESTVTLVATKATEADVLNLELLLPTEGEEFEALRNVSININIVPELDYFEQSKDVFGGFFYQPWKLEEFAENRHLLPDDPLEALGRLHEASVRPFGFEGPRPDYSSLRPTLGNPFLMNSPYRGSCAEDCVTGVMLKALGGTAGGAVTAVGFYNQVTSGQPFTPMTIPIRLGVAALGGSFGFIGGAIVGAKEDCHCDGDAGTQSAPGTNSTTGNNKGTDSAPTDHTKQEDVKPPEQLPPEPPSTTSTPNPEAPPIHAPALPSDPLAELKKPPIKVKPLIKPGSNRPFPLPIDPPRLRL